MRRLAVLVCGLLLLSLLVLAIGCAKDIIIEVDSTTDSASSCISCHSDAEILYETAEEEEATSAESEGEG